MSIEELFPIFRDYSKELQDKTPAEILLARLLRNSTQEPASPGTILAQHALTSDDQLIAEELLFLYYMREEDIRAIVSLAVKLPEQRRKEIIADIMHHVLSPG